MAAFAAAFWRLLGNGRKKHETAFFWSRCYGMTKKVKHRQLRVILFFTDLIILRECLP
jgi:hypothetical protein